MSQKALNLLPPVGGATGALFEVFPNFTSIMNTVILAAIGAIVGYGMKYLLDYLFKKKVQNIDSKAQN